jgi:hypothetical protein
LGGGVADRNRIGTVQYFHQQRGYAFDHGGGIVADGRAVCRIGLRAIHHCADPAGADRHIEFTLCAGRRLPGFQETVPSLKEPLSEALINALPAPEVIES